VNWTSHFPQFINSPIALKLLATVSSMKSSSSSLLIVFLLFFAGTKLSSSRSSESISYKAERNNYRVSEIEQADEQRLKQGGTHIVDPSSARFRPLTPPRSNSRCDAPTRRILRTSRVRRTCLCLRSRWSCFFRSRSRRFSCGLLRRAPS
jgi:hypothetical protein